MSDNIVRLSDYPIIVVFNIKLCLYLQYQNGITQTKNIMNNQTKKLIYTQKGELNKHVKNALSHCSFLNGKIYTGYYSGSGRYTSSHSAMGTITDILEAQGYKYTTGNDAPKGGIKGEYVKVSKVAFEFIAKLTK